MRSRSARASDTSPSSSTTTAAGSCGPAAGRDRKTVETFLDALGNERCQQIELVSCDMADVDHPAGRRALPERRASASTRSTSSSSPPTRSTRSAARSGTRRAAPARRSSPRELKGARFALWKNPEQPHRAPAAKLAHDPATQPAALPRLPAQRAAARDLPRPAPTTAIALLDAWLAWARRCRLAPFVKLARTITEQRRRDRGGRSTRPLERTGRAINTQLRLITRRAFGFHSPHAADRARDAHPRRPLPPLPGR